jgi:aminobenzoyl-glutamate utilization protein B
VKKFTAPLTPFALAACLASPCLQAAETTQAWLAQHESTVIDLADSLWAKAEVGYQEIESSSLLQKTLSEEGFSVKAGVANIPTAFVAEYGSSGPVIALLAEFDALPGISQSISPFAETIEGKHAAHACGHHLFGAGSVGAAITLRHWLEENKVPGRVRLYGTPAEEGGSGKVYMVRAGLFDDADVVMHWHPDDNNSASAFTTLANKSAKFRFKGVSAHAAVAPEFGRSALDGIEAMNTMVNMMREHVPQETRIHYVITAGGNAPNVVPNFAESFYYARHPNAATLEGIWERLLNTARAAALGTGTTVEWEIIHGNHSILPNETLAKVMYKNLSASGGVKYNSEEAAYAETIKATFPVEKRNEPSPESVETYGFYQRMGSTDVGDVSWNVPTVGLSTATWVPGTSAHTWQAVAAGGMSIGHKGMLLAADVMAKTAMDLYSDPQLIEQAKQEFVSRRGKDFHYAPLLGDREPPLDYRK